MKKQEEMDHPGRHGSNGAYRSPDRLGGTAIPLEENPRFLASQAEQAAELQGINTNLDVRMTSTASGIVFMGCEK